MSQPANLKKQHHNQIFAITPGSCVCRSPCINTLLDPVEELDELAGAQGQAKKPNVGNDEASTPLKAPTLPFVSLPAKNLFRKFIKVFIEMTQAQAKPRECSQKTKTTENY